MLVCKKTQTNHARQTFVLRHTIILEMSKKMTSDEDMFTQIMLLFSNLLAVIVAFLSANRYTQLNYG